MRFGTAHPFEDYGSDQNGLEACNRWTVANATDARRSCGCRTDDPETRRDEKFDDWTAGND